MRLSSGAIATGILWIFIGVVVGLAVGLIACNHTRRHNRIQEQIAEPHEPTAAEINAATLKRIQDHVEWKKAHSNHDR